MSYVPGQTIRFTATFKDSTGALIDPPTVVFKIKPYGGTTVTATVVRDSLGAYHADYTPTQATGYAYRFETTGGTITAAAEGVIVVDPTKV